MTHDDLTPEEREALSSLPRERTPSAGLEDRVVAAMREKGHIATRKPARVIRLTTSRVAGLLAACVVLMIGAYSIGLHGRVSNEVLKNIEPQPRQDSGYSELKKQSLPAAGAPSSTGSVTNEQVDRAAEPEAHFVEKKAPAFQPKLNLPQIATSKDTEKKTESSRDEVSKSMQKTFSEGIAQGNMPEATDLKAPMSPPMPAQLRAKAAQPEVSSSAEMSSLASRSRTFALNGATLIVDAPDSLRIVTDEHGRTLLIYTSDGIIRIRLAD